MMVKVTGSLGGAVVGALEQAVRSSMTAAKDPRIDLLISVTRPFMDTNKCAALYFDTRGSAGHAIADTPGMVKREVFIVEGVLQSVGGDAFNKR
jgi:hypothetical protein